MDYCHGEKSEQSPIKQALDVCNGAVDRCNHRKVFIYKCAHNTKAFGKGRVVKTGMDHMDVRANKSEHKINKTESRARVNTESKAW